jgi:hypothetical protein
MMEYWNQGGSRRPQRPTPPRCPASGNWVRFAQLSLVPRPWGLVPPGFARKLGLFCTIRNPSGPCPGVSSFRFQIINHQSPIINSEALPRTRLSLYPCSVLHESCRNSVRAGRLRIAQLLVREGIKNFWIAGCFTFSTVAQTTTGYRLLTNGNCSPTTEAQPAPAQTGGEATEIRKPRMNADEHDPRPAAANRGVQRFAGTSGEIALRGAEGVMGINPWDIGAGDPSYARPAGGPRPPRDTRSPICNDWGGFHYKKKRQV